MSHVLSGTSTHRQAHSQQCPFRNPTKAHCTPGPPRVSRQKGRCQAVKEAVQSRDLKSDAELFAEEVGAQDVPSPEAALPDPDRVQQLRQECAAAAKQVEELQQKLDALYKSAFSGVQADHVEGGQSEQLASSAAFGKLGREQAKAMQRLIEAKQKQDPRGWQQFQSEAATLKLQMSRAAQQQEAAATAADAAEMAAQTEGEGGATEEASPLAGQSTCRIVLISGFESFNVNLYKQAAREVAQKCPGVTVSVFSDRDLEPQQHKIEAELDRADVFFASLLFDYDQVEWLRSKIQHIPIRLAFESALELMGTTQLNTFQMDPSGKSKGPPPAVKKLLGMFGSGREEDRMVGYLSFLKMGPKLLRFLPGKKARDLQNWLTVYGYWNQGGQQNVTTMLLYLVDKYFRPLELKAGPPVETPATGCLHPDHGGFFESPAAYMRWYQAHGPLRGSDAPVAAVLVYRKHVITAQPYIPELIRTLESQGVLPLPIFINGVEAHTLVRDSITTEHEQRLIAANSPAVLVKPSKDAAKVDVIVSTIGFPLVGGPAGTMEGGRQAEIAQGILASKNVPYMVAAPLLIQDMASWSRDGVAGLQSVVLYSLPELDGAIDTVPLGGLVGDGIFLSLERVRKLAARIKRWVALRRTTPQDRKVAVLVYGFPPNVGATGTAALLNVPKSLEKLLEALRDQGYNLGPDGAEIDGEAIITALKMQEDQRAILEGSAGILKRGAGEAESSGFQAAAAEVGTRQLRQALEFPPETGPSDWGPIPYLPEPDVLVQNMESQWGALDAYRGLNSTATGSLLVSGVQLGNVWIGVQPALGVEGDPMRLLFERDFTPHPQYAAFYHWLAEEWSAHALLHFGMHGTAEWLPGAPLGNTGTSWSDVLLGSLPNIYVYACNNPSETIVAKRRGYATIVSHNVPPYGRAGLYKQLAELKNLLAEFREAPARNSALRKPIVQTLNASGLQNDCPFRPDANGQSHLAVDDAEQVAAADFEEYASRLNTYLQEVEGRLFSEGLHVLGQQPRPEQMKAYLGAYFGPKLPEHALDAVAAGGNASVEDLRRQLESSFTQDPPGTSNGDGHAGLAQDASSSWQDNLEEAVQVRELLQRNTEELAGVLGALQGDYVLPAAGGDLLRDGAGVLPTGRNIHALDPYRMPSPGAIERGIAAAEAILQQHRQEHDGAWPETVAVNLWGLDAIKTKGESVAIVLHLLGARPLSEGTGRIARFELVPLEQLEPPGRPRVDALCNMSGIFRDSFQNVVELLDDLFRRAGEADEPDARNFVRKHVRQMEGQGLQNPHARLFSNPAGDYGSMVNERVGTSNWESSSELGDTWASRNSFSYGRGAERGTARPEVLKAVLGTTQRVVQEIDSVEYGLTDIQEYYANTGALKQAATDAQGGKRVGCSVVETFGEKGQARDLDEVLRLEYRSKLLNPKWAQAMADQGSGGAFEISQRMTAMLGWGATTDFREDWTWDQAADTYALDSEMAAKLQNANPQAMSNMLRRMLEASGRGMWNANSETLQRLQQMYGNLQDKLEGV